MSNKYLEKIALRRIVSEFAKGNVSTPLATLVGKGFVKKPKVYAEGMRRGNKALAEISGTAVNRSNSEAMSGVLSGAGGYATIPHKSGPKVVFGGVESDILAGATGGHWGRRQRTDINQSAAIRHEIHEAREAKDMMPKAPDLIGKIDGVKIKAKELVDRVMNKLTGKQPPPFLQKAQKNETRLAGSMKAISNTNFVTQPFKNADVEHIVEQFKGKPRAQAAFSENPAEAIRKTRDHLHSIGNHYSARVLGRESEDVRKNPYLKDSMMFNHRTRRGEGEMIQKVTGKRYGMDKLTGKDLKKLHNIKTEQIDGRKTVNITDL